ncbi:MAG: hypothetical protein P1U89_17350 [Verrucomicrobiales bacterium]|nr:hypothetical protein [Verrucomicrobiales bacterium]
MSIVPSDYPRIKRVSDFEELVSTPFNNGVNALCWSRELNGDFGEVVRLLEVDVGITTIDEDVLSDLEVSEEGRLAIELIQSDLENLRNHDLDPVLDCVNGYLPPDEPGLIPTDVCSFHVDSATVEADTYLCTYFGAPSEGLRNDQAVRRVDIPETRAMLLKEYGGRDDAGFVEFLNDNFYDLHYLPTPGAVPFSFGVGNIWRIATLYPDSPVPPCVHRAPAPVAGKPPRLLLIS